MRTGLYWLSPGQQPKPGEVAIACVPWRFASWARSVGVLGAGSFCGGFEPVVKRVAAAAGDRVTLSASGVYVNGRYQPGTRPLSSIQGRAIPHVFETWTLRPGAVLLLGDNRDASFDGRYFGSTNHVLGRAVIIKPAWIFAPPLGMMILVVGLAFLRARVERDRRRAFFTPTSQSKVS